MWEQAQHEGLLLQALLERRGRIFRAIQWQCYLLHRLTSTAARSHPRRSRRPRRRPSPRRRRRLSQDGRVRAFGPLPPALGAGLLHIFVHLLPWAVPGRRGETQGSGAQNVPTQRRRRAARLQIFYGYFTTVARSKATNIVAENILPVLRQWLTFMESSLGPASKFTPSTTHVLMVGWPSVVGPAVAPSAAVTAPPAGRCGGTECCRDCPTNWPLPSAPPACRLPSCW